MKIRAISIKDVEYVAHALASETMSWNEPIPGFGTRFPHALERCLEAPFQSFGGKPLYPGLLKKTAIFFYLMIKNHPFQNGNKRIAMTATFYLLHKNGKWLEVDSQELYNFAKWVAESNPKLKEATMSAIETFFGTYLVQKKK